MPTKSKSQTTTDRVLGCRLPRNRPPTHPGEMLFEEFVKPLELTQTELARRKLDQINRVRDVKELKIPPGNHLKRLKGDREKQYSIRINQQYRICFIWEEGHAYEVEITDYH